MERKKESKVNEELFQTSKDKINTRNFVLSKLYKIDKTLRDPVHGDIILNHLEVRVIDTKCFQRLRRIRQLGTSYLVFSGAEHSRFQHSIGTLHMAQILLQNISENEFSQYHQYFSRAEDSKLREFQSEWFRLIVRLAALLHDFQEFPFSHTLEKEGHIYESQWHNKILNQYYLGKNSEIYPAIWRYISHDILEENREQVDFSDIGGEDFSDFSKRVARTIITLAFLIISGKKKEGMNNVASMLFEEESDIFNDFIDNDFLTAGSQIVNDTICSDLLDYVARDFYFSGIKKTFDQRFLKYAVVCNSSTTKNDIVFAYRIIGRKGDLKTSVLSSLLDLLELRYTLNEVVHVNKTKNSFSSMVIEAFNHYFQLLNDDQKVNFSKEISEIGDDELLFLLRDRDEDSRYILDYYYKREPYKGCQLWDVTDWKESTSKEGICFLEKADERFQLEVFLAKALSKISKINFRYGDFLLYVMPDPTKMYKELKTYILFSAGGDNRVETLENLASQDLQPFLANPYEIKRGIIKRIASEEKHLIENYNNLWCTSLFFSPRVCELNNYEDIKNSSIRLINEVLKIVVGGEEWAVVNEKISGQMKFNDSNLINEINDFIGEVNNRVGVARRKATITIKYLNELLLNELLFKK